MNMWTWSARSHIRRLRCKAVANVAEILVRAAKCHQVSKRINSPEVIGVDKRLEICILDDSFALKKNWEGTNGRKKG